MSIVLWIVGAWLIGLVPLGLVVGKALQDHLAPVEPSALSASTASGTGPHVPAPRGVYEPATDPDDRRAVNVANAETSLQD